MKAPYLASLVVLVATALPGVACARASDGRPVRNSFIDRPVGEISDLLAHVKADRVVADRYQRHFSMDRTTLLRFLGGLHRGRLKQDGVYTIYSVPQGGRLRMHVGKIRRGEAMFFNRSGQPTLVAKCGNPIVLGPSRPLKGSPVDVVPGDAPEARTLDLGLALLADETVALEPSLPPTEVAVAAATAFDVPATPACDVIPVTAAGSGTGTFLASLGFLASFAATLPAEKGTHRQAEPVPEPATLLVLAFGGCGLLQRSQRRA